MHECHAVQDIFNQALEKARQNKAKKVARITLVVGELLGFDPGSIKLYFEELAEGTILEGAELVINPKKPTLQCKDCDTSFEKEKSNLTCPSCSSTAVAIQSGKEFFIDSLEVES
jgi:hydrogenase nickel incorporation protein HypA/HybF